MTFTYDFGSIATAMNLYLDVSNQETKSVLTQTTAISEESSIKGFRVGFINQAENSYRVWDNKEAYSEGVAKYTTSTSAVATYPQTNFIDSTAVDQVTNETASVSAEQLRTKLGTFAVPGSGTTSTVTLLCYAWFEGNDATQIHNETQMENFAAKLSFYVASK